MSTQTIKNPYKIPGTNKNIPYQGYGYGSVFNVPAIFTNPGQGQSQYPGVPEGMVIEEFPNSRRNPRRNTDPGTFQIGTPPAPDPDRVVTPAEAAAIPAATGPGRFDPDQPDPNARPWFGPQVVNPGGLGAPTGPGQPGVYRMPGAAPIPGAPAGAGAPQRGGIGGFFDKLTSSPNVESMYTAGSILAGNPQPNESQMQQVIRSIGGAMSTRGAYAQMQRAQAEAARKADLERRKVQVEEQNARTQAATQDAAERQKDNEGDLAVTTQNDTRAHQVRADEAAAMDSKGLDAWRKQQIKRSDADIERLQKEYQLELDQFNADKMNKANSQSLQYRKLALERKRLEIEAKRADAYSLSVKSQAELFKDFKRWDRAVKLAGGSEGLDLLGKGSDTQYNRISDIDEDLRDQEAGVSPEVRRQRRKERAAKRAAEDMVDAAGGEGESGGGGGKVDAKGRKLDSAGYYEGQVVDDEKGTGWVRRNGGWVPEKR